MFESEIFDFTDSIFKPRITAMLMQEQNQLIDWYNSLPIYAIILGAGASVDAGYPLYSEITDPSSLNHRLSYIRPDSGELKKLLEMCMRISEKGTHFEKLVEQAAKDDQEFLQYCIDYYTDLLTIPEYHLPYLKKVAGYMSAYLQLPWLCAPFQIHIFSFNQDMIVERCLDWNFQYEEAGRIFSFRSCGAGTNVMEPISAGEKHYSNKRIYLPFPTLHKLHGSINIIKCGNCGAIAYSDVPIKLSVDGYGLHFLLLYPCPVCDAKGLWKSTIIPPTTEKDVSAIESSWQRAMQVLKQSTFVSIIGYSMPDYDQEANKLIESISNHAIVDIINPAPSKYLLKTYKELTARVRLCKFYETTLKTHTLWNYEWLWGKGVFSQDLSEFFLQAPVKPKWSIKDGKLVLNPETDGQRFEE